MSVSKVSLKENEKYNKKKNVFLEKKKKMERKKDTTKKKKFCFFNRGYKCSSLPVTHFPGLGPTIR